MFKSSFNHSFSLLNIDYVKLGNSWDFKNVISPYYRLYYIDEGIGTISDKSDLVILEPGFLYLIPSFTICNLNCDDYLSQYFIQFFEESHDGVSLFNQNRNILKIPATETDIILIKLMLKNNPGRGIRRSNNPLIYEKEVYYKEYRSLNNELKPSLKFENQGILLLLISKFLQTINNKQNTVDRVPSKILEAIRYIQLNLNKNISVTELAERANQNLDYFSKKFLQHTGQRPLNYVHEKRIERAQYLIATTNKIFLEIALDTGFSNLSHFFKLFKQITRMTPGEYRSKLNV